MTGLTFQMSDIERLGAILDERCADLDERDRALLHAVFAWAGHAAGADSSEVEGFATDPLGQPVGVAQTFCKGTHYIEIMSFSWGASNPTSPGTGQGDQAGKSSVAELNIKP